MEEDKNKGINPVPHIPQEPEESEEVQANGRLLDGDLSMGTSEHRILNKIGELQKEVMESSKETHGRLSTIEEKIKHVVTNKMVLVGLLGIIGSAAAIYFKSQIP